MDSCVIKYVMVCNKDFKKCNKDIEICDKFCNETIQMCNKRKEAYNNVV